MFSGKTNYHDLVSPNIWTRQRAATHLIEFVAKVYRINVVAFQVREHDDLSNVSKRRDTRRQATHEENHAEKQSSGHEDRE